MKNQVAVSYSYVSGIEISMRVERSPNQSLLSAHRSVDPLVMSSNDPRRNGFSDQIRVSVIDHSSSHNGT